MLKPEIVLPVAEFMSNEPLMVTSVKVEEPVDAVTLPVKLPVTLPITLPVTPPVTLPVRLPVKPELADTVVNAPLEAVVPPIGVLLIVPPPMVTEVPKPAVPLTLKLVKLPAARVVAPIGVLSMVLLVMAKA